MPYGASLFFNAKKTLIDYIVVDLHDSVYHYSDINEKMCIIEENK